MRRLPRVLALLILVGGEVVALAVLLRLGTRPPFALPRHDINGWLRATTPPDALAAVLRVVAIAVSGWSLIITVAYSVARAARAPAAIRATAWSTVPAVRRMVDAALTASIVAGSVTAPFVVPSSAGAAGGPAPTSSTPTRSAVRDGRATTFPSGTAAAGPTAVETVVVTVGDDLWQIAARQLARLTGGDATQLDPELLASYWLAVCKENRAVLRSGDVNLIVPGEVLTLPPIPPAPPGGALGRAG